jgi:undecaprenol kinase
MKRFLSRLDYAFQGALFALRTEIHMRIHAAASVIVFIMAALLGVTRLEWVILAGVCSLVLMAELINTAVENAVDLITGDPHPLAKAAKDTAAAAVLTAAVFAIAAGLLILGPPLCRMLGKVMGK